MGKATSAFLTATLKSDKNDKLIWLTRGPLLRNFLTGRGHPVRVCIAFLPVLPLSYDSHQNMPWTIIMKFEKKSRRRSRKGYLSWSGGVFIAHVIPYHMNASPEFKPKSSHFGSAAEALRRYASQELADANCCILPPHPPPPPIRIDPNFSWVYGDRYWYLHDENLLQREYIPYFYPYAGLIADEARPNNDRFVSCCEFLKEMFRAVVGSWRGYKKNTPFINERQPINHKICMTIFRLAEQTERWQKMEIGLTWRRHEYLENFFELLNWI